MSTRRTVTFTEPRTAEVVEGPIPDPEAGEVRVRTTLSAVSPGTETLIYRGEAPSDVPADPTIESLSGGLEFPITYGYAAVGRVEAVGAEVDDAWVDRRVFSFQPHTSHFIAEPSALTPIPDDVLDEDAVMIPNLETAVNLVMDARPMIGERAVVFGQGVVGLLTTALLSRFPLEALYAVEARPERRERALEWGADRVFAPDEVQDGGATLAGALGGASGDAVDAAAGEYEGADLIVELTGQPRVLDDAVAVAGYDGRIVVGSWYGEKEAPLHLGGRFHRGRIQVQSSQVSSIDPDHRGRWSKKRRMQTVVDHLSDVRPGGLVSDLEPVEQAPQVYDALSDSETDVLVPVFRYS